jgi:flagellar FliL protein
MAEATAKKEATESKKHDEKASGQAPEKAKLAAVSKESHDAQVKPKRDLLNLSILGLSLVNVTVLVAMGWFINKMSIKIREVQEKTTSLIEASNSEESERSKAKEKKKQLEAKLIGKELVTAPQGTLYPLDSFLVNIGSDQGAKFLQTQLELELSDPSVEEEVTKKRAALRDAIIVLLSSKSYKELREPNGIKGLRVEVQKAINSLLTTGSIREVFFTQFHFN